MVRQIKVVSLFSILSIILLCLNVSAIGPEKEATETVVELKYGKEVSTVKKVRQTLIDAGVFKKPVSLEGDLEKLVLFDFDGIVFPLGGSGPQHFDQEFGNLIKELKAVGVTVGGLTHRSDKSASKSRQTFAQYFGGFNMLPGVFHRVSEHTSIQGGSFYVNRYFDKGVAIKEIFRKINKGPGRKIGPNTTVVFIDDMPRNLKNVARACREQAVGKLINIHYVASWKAAKRVKIGGFFVGPVQLAYRKFANLLPRSIMPNF